MNDDKRKNGGDIERNLPVRNSDQERETGSFFQNGFEHFNFSPKKIITMVSIFSCVGFIGSNMLGFVRGYKSVISGLHEEVFEAVPKSPYETRAGNKVTLYRQITNMDEAIVTLQSDVETLKNTKDFEEVHDSTPTQGKKNRGKK